MKIQTSEKEAEEMKCYIVHQDTQELVAPKTRKAGKKVPRESDSHIHQLSPICFFL